MGVKIKHTDPTLNSFSTDDIIVNVSEGSLFFKSNTELFRIKGDTMSTAVTESFGDELWLKSGDNIFYPDEVTPIISIGNNLTPSTQGSFPEVIISGSLAIRNTDARIELDDSIGDKFRIQNQNGIFKIIQHSDSIADNEILAISGSRVGIGTETPAYTLDLGENSSTIRLVSENNGTAIRIGAGGNSNDVTLLRVDGESSDHDGESDDSHFGFSLKYMGSRSGNANSLSIFSDAEAGTAVEALTVLQDGKVGIGKTNPSTELDVPGTGSFGRIETLTISASTGDFDASTIRIGGEPLNRSNLVALKEGRSIQSVARDLGEGDSAITNITRIAAVMSVDDDSTYTKMKGIGRMATFISGSLFHDLQKSPTINLARIGDGDTNLLFSGSIVSASINGGSF